ncbi:hypothetical protein JNA64_13860 [Pseudomonas stutzeri]|uniref:hypothetical protein n=1 Tax=Stutzerimonas stutzeri TaxID=316 RepID=UPI001F526CB3|nr:hypothetical protein [Stutzerimonas stutzeri]MCI0918253.1 hypothetical protein [Stutzerimonas stutzeri]
MADSLGLTQYIGIVLGSGVVSAFITQLITWYREYRKENNLLKINARLSAIFAIGRLEEYAIACYRVIDNNFRLTQDLGEHEADGQHDLDFPNYPEFDANNLRYLNKEVVTNLLTHSSHLSLTIEYLKAHWEHDIGPEFVERFNNQVGYFGYWAWTLAQELRTTHKLPELQLPAINHYVEELLGSFSERAIQAAKRERASIG